MHAELDVFGHRWRIPVRHSATDRRGLNPVRMVVVAGKSDEYVDHEGFKRWVE